MREGRTMEKIPIQKIARVLGVLVTVTLICNFIALLLVPDRKSTRLNSSHM